MHYLLNQVMRVQMAVKAFGHFLVYCRCMRFAVAIPAMGYTRMLSAVTESTGERLMLGGGFCKSYPFLFMTCDTETARCCKGRGNLQWMVGRMAAQTIACNLTLDMGLMALSAFGDLTVNFVAECTILLGVFARVIGKILSRAFMACQAGILYIRSKMQGQRLMGVGMAAEAVFKFEMGLSFMTLLAFRNNIFSPGRMLLVAV